MAYTNGRTKIWLEASWRWPEAVGIGLLALGIAAAAYLTLRRCARITAVILLVLSFLTIAHEPSCPESILWNELQIPPSPRARSELVYPQAFWHRSWTMQRFVLDPAHTSLYVITSASLFLSTVALYWFRKPRDPDYVLRCPFCGYLLRGVRGDHCPECGKPISEYRQRVIRKSAKGE
ncbi:MAG: hypothetical protein SYC29_08645 [Planctomycetota bacterium]|nr:hypothetical protein [Planctomycetota bacterium]